jgi:hypothetical protein
MPNINKAVLRPRATFIGPGIYGTGSEGKFAAISKAHTLELGHWHP